MSETGLTKWMRVTSYGWMKRAVTIGLAGGMAAGLAGCVSINAPTKPIQINLNISVTQEVVYRLDSSAKELIQDNPNIF